MVDIQVLASGSRGNCYRINDGSTPLLLECGISYKEIQKGLNFRIAEIASCLISHEHKDHCKAVRDMMKAGIDCYMSQGTADALSISGHRLHIVRAKQQFRIGTWTILPFETQHDAAEPLGFLLATRGAKLLYLTDSAYCKYRFNGLTHILIECNHAADILQANVESGAVPAEMKKRIIRSHMSLDTVKDFFRANDLSQVQEIWLLHMSYNNSDSERFKREIQEISGKPVYIVTNAGREGGFWS